MKRLPVKGELHKKKHPSPEVENNVTF